MRIATYNVEWFTGLFGDDDQLLDDDNWSARHGITRAQQAGALATVLRAMDADAVMIIEAPDQSRSRRTLAALQGFADHFKLRTNRAVMGFSNDTQQEIALLYDATALRAVHIPGGQNAEAGRTSYAPKFDGVLHIDLDIDATQDRVVFSKPPLELNIETRSGFKFHMIGVHLKSKAPHGAKTPEDALRIGVANRRKQLAQAVWLRRRIEERLEDADPLMVLGDLNDGPGLDAFEDLFERSSLEIVMGHRGSGALIEPHATRALGRKVGVLPTTSRFWIEAEQRYLEALLDYIMVSPGFTARNPRWRIWHPLDDPECWANSELRDALVAASDHFPVTIDFDG